MTDELIAATAALAAVATAVTFWKNWESGRRDETLHEAFAQREQELDELARNISEVKSALPVDESSTEGSASNDPAWGTYGQISYIVSQKYRMIPRSALVASIMWALHREAMPLSAILASWRIESYWPNTLTSVADRGGFLRESKTTYLEDLQQGEQYWRKSKANELAALSLASRRQPSIIDPVTAKKAVEPLGPQR